MTQPSEQVPNDLPQLMTVPYVAKHRLVGYTTVISVNKLIINKELPALNLARPGAKINKFRLRREDIVAYWRAKEKGQLPAPARPQKKERAPKAPARNLPRKRDK